MIKVLEEEDTMLMKECQDKMEHYLDQRYDLDNQCQDL